MVFFNYTTMQMTAKIVYYGPGLCGKTTNLLAIHQKTAPKSRGEMVSLETETDRTLFFDLLPLDVGVIGGMKVRLQLYTVPGQVFYNATRKLVLKGVDGIVFVADSQTAALEANMESYKNLQANLDELALKLDQIPLAFQYNKRDIRNILPVEKLNEVLNDRAAPHFEAAALHGIGVFETLKVISRLALSSIRKKIGPEEPRKTLSAPPAAAAPVLVPSAVLQAPPEDTNPLASLIPEGAPPEEVPVEFAEEDSEKHQVRAVQTKAKRDIERELEGLRLIATAPSSRSSSSTSPPSKDLEKRLQDLLPAQDSKQEVKRKVSLEVPGHLLKDASAMKIHLAFDGQGPEELVRDAVTVKLVGNRRLERLTLHIDLEIKGKP